LHPRGRICSISGELLVSMHIQEDTP
jgi:hypothetical protein